VHVLPWLRSIGGRVLLPDWLAITIGRDIVCWRPLDAAELAHELAHVRQWDRYGVLFVARYARASWRATGAGGHWYRDNAFEVAARSAAADARAAGIAARAPATAPPGASAEGGHPGT
jgi:hypothetical protein